MDVGEVERGGMEGKFLSFIFKSVGFVGLLLQQAFGGKLELFSRIFTFNDPLRRREAKRFRPMPKEEEEVVVEVLLSPSPGGPKSLSVSLLALLLLLPPKNFKKADFAEEEVEEEVVVVVVLLVPGPGPILVLPPPIDFER